MLIFRGFPLASKKVMWNNRDYVPRPGGLGVCIIERKHSLIVVWTVQVGFFLLQEKEQKACLEKGRSVCLYSP